jgi:hypothetical protein
MVEGDLQQLGAWIVEALRAPDDASLLAELRRSVETHCRRFPVPGIDT